MTHFATADEPGDELFPEQLERFTAFVEAIRAEHPDAVVHAANSAATLRDPAAHFDMVRCGVAIYGLDPFQGDPRERGLEPALALESWVAALRRFEPGDGAGYGRRWTGERADLGGHGADRLRRRLAARPLERLRRADRRPQVSAGGHGEHGQHHRRRGAGPGVEMGDPWC